MASNGTPKVPIICGIATLTMLTSIAATKLPNTTVPATAHLPAGARTSLTRAIAPSRVQPASLLHFWAWAGYDSTRLPLLLRTCPARLQTVRALALSCEDLAGAHGGKLLATFCPAGP